MSSLKPASSIKPTIGSERLQVIDALGGFALLGILFANLYSFIGYGTYSPEEIIVLSILDRAVLFFIDWFVEGKFYGIFSILFLQWLFGRVWLRRFKQGPLEFVWRKLTYRSAKSR